jgi:hypothetical protein
MSAWNNIINLNEVNETSKSVDKSNNLNHNINLNDNNDDG